MGGRGGSSGLSKASSEQKRLMNNLVKRNSKEKWYSVPEFTMNKDGSVSYQYKTERTYTYAHGGKMIGPEKDDIFLRTTFESGKIMKDGLRKKNKSVVEDKIIKRGKR